MSQLLISCKKCYASRLADRTVDRCGSCGSPEVTVHQSAELDPANPSDFPTDKKGEIAVALSRPVWSGARALDFYGAGEYPTYADFMGIDRAAATGNAHISEMADYSTLTLAALEESYNRAAYGMRIAAVDAATAAWDRTVVSRLTQEWKRPDPKPPRSERLEFPIDRKITVK